jgi:asparagine synthase (glutamine-hydrolysing)
MCGIWARLGVQPKNESTEYWVQRLRERGPEGVSIQDNVNYTLAFTRLAINGLNSGGMQPMNFGSISYVCNGEIYNWKDLASRYNIHVESGSDCEIIGELWEKFASVGTGASFFQTLDGVFSIVIIDDTSKHAYVARDPYGVRPLFVGYRFGTPVKVNDPKKTYIQNGDNLVPIENLYFASEMKALQMCDHIEVFPPGHCAAYDLQTFARVGFEPYHSVPWIKNPCFEDENVASTSIRVALEAAVKKRMMTERPVAALLSGGLDSSLIAAIVQRNLKEAGAPALKTFSIGFEGSEDLRCARLVADYIGSDHTEVVMTAKEFFDAVPDVIAAIESFDITTVRASVGNWLVSREIAKTTDCKVVFNGDGSDEVLGGYRYFQKAPSNEAFDVECGRLLKDIHYFDVLRSDRSISSNGLEARTPFLDKQFVALARSIPASLHRKFPEKYILRKAFEGVLPEEILWRRKEAFSDGVSGSKPWFQECQERSDAILLDGVEPWKVKAKDITYLQPKTAEAYYYRWVFNKKYGKNFDSTVVPYHWMPKWSPDAKDPSARTLDIY